MSFIYFIGILFVTNIAKIIILLPPNLDVIVIKDAAA